MANHRLLIRHFRAQYLVPSDHHAPRKSAAQLDETVTRDLAATLSAAISPAFSPSDETLCFIRSLDIALDVNLSWDRDELARAWAADIARCVALTVSGGSDGDNVRVFTSRAAYLAAFLHDLAEGRAWNKWYFRSFDGLRPLSLSAALRTATCADPASGEEALQLLPPVPLASVLRSLSVHDCGRILDALPPGGAPADPDACFLAAWTALEWRGDYEEEPRSSLRLYLAAGNAAAGLRCQALKNAVRALVRLSRCLGELPAAQRRKVLAAVAGGDGAALYDAAGPLNSGFIEPVLEFPAPLREEVARGLAQRILDAVPEAVAPGPRYTRFGGIFLLLPLLDQLPIEEAACGWPDCCGIRAPVLVRFLLLVKCCGELRAPDAFRDLLLRDLMLVPGTVSPVAVAEWQEKVTRVEVRRFQEMLAGQHLPGGGNHLLVTRIPAPGRALDLFIDSDGGEWVAVATGPGRRGAVDALSDEAARAEIRNFYYLSLSRSLGIKPCVDRALTVAAQRVLRRFARALPGFGGSNFPYLYSNFLDCTATVTDEPARRVVTLTRPPLYLVLARTGMLRSAYRLSWLDDREFTLFPEGG